MLGFDSADVKFAKAQLSNDKENRMMDADVRVAESMFDPNKVALDSQISAIILEVKSRFLKYKVDYNKGTVICVEKFPFVEPWGDEPVSFLEGQKPNIIGEIDMLLSEMYKFTDNYDEPTYKTFNEIVRVRQSLMGLSRATGRAAKVAKSQYVESNAFIRRDGGGNKSEQKGLFGIGIMGL